MNTWYSTRYCKEKESRVKTMHVYLVLVPVQYPTASALKCRGTVALSSISTVVSRDTLPVPVSGKLH